MSEVIAAFCGTGKTYLVDKGLGKEVECWKFDYESDKFPRNYLKAIYSLLGTVDYILISTNPVGFQDDLPITLYYPRRELKQEYMQRFRIRDSHPDFINAVDKYWDVWLQEVELQSQRFPYFILESGEFLADKLSLFELKLKNHERMVNRHSAGT